ncbi:hypothetical protein BD324DRAFT_37901 [Kockovaella imperatae]|uniref:3-keto sterol reductase n=1 Tax=Kockovaella imperatae TaxID=4999 RepID=A0A1Y1UT17_9TREE|nr:hypothetical protein BD324DRAFT_37901 [Kockovaella imperatae]ORX41092.1 hypothetical protein BD324DRAFT_37901 [Kockovaella imperatae]
MPAAVIQKTALPPSRRQVLIDQAPELVSEVSDRPPATLTLIVTCRSMQNAIETKEAILETHMRELKMREKNGIPERNGWLAGLRIECETADLSSPGGSDGVLALCERLKKSYPHITSLFLNAAIATASSISFPGFLKQIFTEGFVETVTDPHFVPETPGVMTPDGRLGLVFSVNVLSVYIMARELEPLLRRSPKELPVPPRIILSSSYTAARSLLRPDPLDDYQLLTYSYENGEFPYKASKYMADLLAVQLDKEFSENQGEDTQELRMLIAEPGAMVSKIYTTAFTNWAIIKFTFTFFYALAFRLASLLGSPKHVLTAGNGALAMIFAALVDSQYIEPASKVPATKFESRLNRWKHHRIEYSEVDCWESTLDLGASLMKACETIRQEYRRRESLE